MQRRADEHGVAELHTMLGHVIFTACKCVTAMPCVCVCVRQVMRQRADEHGVAEVKWMDLGHHDGSHTGIASGQ